MLGAAALSYTCPSDKSICYSLNSPATHATFQDLQSQINRYAHVAGFATLTQDGLIGEASVSAAKKAMSYAEGHLADGGLKASVIMIRPMIMSRQTLAPIAVAVADLLRESAISLGLAVASPGGGGGGGGGGASPPFVPTPGTTLPMPPINLPSGAGFWASRTPTQKAMMGVGGAVGIGALLLLVLPKLKRKRNSGT